MKLFKCFLVVIVVSSNVGRSNGGKETKQSEGKPCAARAVPEESVVCVCNTTYCDTVTRQAPAKDTFVYYTSSKMGLRFKKTSEPLLTCQNSKHLKLCSSVTLSLRPHATHQVIEGFGGAVTDAAGINWKSLSEPLQKLLVDAYYSSAGIEYNMCRVPIGGSDFSTRPYAYNELPTGDAALNNYTLAYEDYAYKIPLVKAGMAASSVPIHVVATTWSPPPWMKTNNQFAGYSRLKPEYFQTYADYHYKFIEKYAAEGVPVWAITTTNEPSNGLLRLSSFNSLGWTADSLGRWIVNNLGPTIRNSTYKDVKIIAGDDQRLTLVYWINRMLEDQPKALDYIDGVAVHYYTDFITPASVLTEVMKSFPQKFLLPTEACEGSFPWQSDKVKLGSWQRAYNYIFDIITDLTHNAVGWLDWNVCLDARGGPNWADNRVDSPIIVYPEKDEFIKQPMFYAMGHFSKFIPRGSRRIEVVDNESFFSSHLKHVAFLTPRKTAVVVFYNKGPSRTVTIKLGNKVAVIQSDEQSITTVEIPYESARVRIV